MGWNDHTAKIQGTVTFPHTGSADNHVGIDVGTIGLEYLQVKIDQDLSSMSTH